MLGEAVSGLFVTMSTGTGACRDKVLATLPITSFDAPRPRLPTARTSKRPSAACVPSAWADALRAGRSWSISELPDASGRIAQLVLRPAVRGAGAAQGGVVVDDRGEA